MTRSDADLRAALASHPFTAGFDDGQIDVLAGCATERTVAAGDHLCRIDDPADHLYLVFTGRAAVEIVTPGRDPLVVATVSAGSVVGWSWLLPPHRAHFDVVALDTVIAVALDAATLRQACEADHHLGYRLTLQLAGVLAGRLEATRLQLVDVYGTPR